MTISQRLDLRQSQTLVMTPQLQQAIKLLQMSNLELGDFVAQEIEQNPLLERADDHGEDGGEAVPLTASAPAEQAISATPASDETAPLSGKETETAPAAEDDQWAEDGSSSEEAFTPSHGGSFDEDDYSAAKLTRRPPRR